MNALTESPATENGTVVHNLTVDETAALLKCEETIRQGMGTFVEVGAALARIRDSGLYKGRYTTFEEYCRSRWDMSARRALQFRDASQLVNNLKEKGFSTLPANEGQARPLTELPTEEQAPAWEEVVGTAPNGRPTAHHIETVVQQRIARLNPKPEPAVASVSNAPLPADDDFSWLWARADTEATGREEQIRALAAEAQATLRQLQDVIRTADGVATSSVTVAVNSMDDLQDHLARVAKMQANRKAKP